MQNMLSRNGVHRSRISYVPYGVELAHIQRDINKGREERLRVGFIGTIVEHKGSPPADQRGPFFAGANSD